MYEPLRNRSALSDVDVRRLFDGVDVRLPLFDGCSECVRDREYRRMCSILLNDGDEAVVVVVLIDRLPIGIW